jgi:transcriptional regulator with XRE-family HTH domain
MARVAYLYGKKLAAAREAKSLTQRDLGESIGGVSDETISRVERGDVSGILAKRLPKLAETLGYSLEKFKAEFVAPKPRDKSSGPPAGLDLRRRKLASVVPEFKVGVAASRRTEKLSDQPDANRVVSTSDRRAFACPADGDCQSPKWKDGEVVIFSYDAFDREGVVPGKSYYLSFSDGTSTFKRVFLDEKDPEVIVLRCWNRRKYPNDQRVHQSEIVRIARAVSKQVIVEEDEE